MAFVVFALYNIVIAFSARQETESAINRDVLEDRRQVMLYGLTLLLAFLPTVLPFLQRAMNLVALSVEQWGICATFALALLFVDEIIKFFMRRQQKQ